jgi:hypothetical protein
LSDANIGQKGLPVKVTDIETGKTQEYVSIAQAAKALAVYSNKVNRCVISKKVLLGRYQIKLASDT